MRRYRVRRATAVTRDLELIEEHLAKVYQDLGDDEAGAAERAATRIVAALAYMRTFESHPHRGTEHPDIRPGLRTVTSRNVVFYFEIDEPLAEVRILAVFFGGANHSRQILDRLSP